VPRDPSAKPSPASADCDAAGASDAADVPPFEELVAFIARQLVDSPDDVSVMRVEQDRSVVYQLRVGPEDIGKVIGKGGRIANALRQIVRAASSRSRRKCTVEIAS